MVAEHRRPNYTSAREYLSREREARGKSEYLSGAIIAMPDDRPIHSAIVANLVAAAERSLQGTPCRVFSSDMKVQVGAGVAYLYPDLAITCREPRYNDVERLEALLNPRVIIEVLSSETELMDRGRKWSHFHTMDCVSDYLLVAQDEARVEHFARRATREWLYTVQYGLERCVEIPSLGCNLALAEIYDGMTFPPKRDSRYPASEEA